MKLELVYFASMMAVADALISTERYFTKSDCSGDPVFILIENNNEENNLQAETCKKEGSQYFSRTISDVTVERNDAPIVPGGVSLFYYRGEDCSGTPNRIESYGPQFSLDGQSYRLTKCTETEMKGSFSGIQKSKSDQNWSGGCNQLPGGITEKSLNYQCGRIFSSSGHNDNVFQNMIGTCLLGGSLLSLF